MGEPVLVAMGMLRPQLVAAAAGRAYDQRDLGPPAEHIADVRRGVHHLVHRDHDEVDGHHLGDRPQPRHGGANGGADDDLLGDGRVEHALLAELLHQPAGHFEGSVVEADVLAQQEHRLVALHLLAERLVERVAHGKDGHQLAASPA